MRVLLVCAVSLAVSCAEVPELDVRFSPDASPDLIGCDPGNATCAAQIAFDDEFGGELRAAIENRGPDNVVLQAALQDVSSFSSYVRPEMQILAPGDTEVLTVTLRDDFATPSVEATLLVIPTLEDGTELPELSLRASVTR